MSLQDTSWVQGSKVPPPFPGRNLFPSFPGASCTLQAGSFQPQEAAGEGLHLPAALFHQGELCLSVYCRPLLCHLGLCGSSCLWVPRPAGRLHHQAKLPSRKGGKKHTSLQKAQPHSELPFHNENTIMFSALSNISAEAAGRPLGDIFLPRAASHSGSPKTTAASLTTLAVSSSPATAPRDAPGLRAVRDGM